MSPNSVFYTRVRYVLLNIKILISYSLTFLSSFFAVILSGGVEGGMGGGM